MCPHTVLDMIRMPLQHPLDHYGVAKLPSPFCPGRYFKWELEIFIVKFERLRTFFYLF